MDDDLLFGGKGKDTLYGGSGDDTMVGGEGDDLLFGDQGNDILDGGLGKDILSAGEGDDSMTGGLDDDLLFGGQGKDTLIGGAGDDLLTGGKGNDTFVYEGAIDQLGQDTLTDFNVSEDAIALNSTDFSALAPGVPGALADGEFQTIANFSGKAADAGDANLIYDPESGLLYYIDKQGITTPMLDMGKNLTLNNDNFDLI
ncbi:hypothetical protein LJE18_00715 [Planktothrix agardhii 1025]|nr:hypothetical protein [Planktothrix agardhii 1025]